MDCGSVLGSLADEWFYKIRNFGQKSQQEVIAKLRDFGLLTRI